MGKVVTSQGLTEFVQSGTVTHVPDHKPNGNGAAPLEVKKDAPTLDVSLPGEKAPEKPPETAAKPPETATEEHDEPLTDDEKTLPEKAQKEIQRAKRAVNKKHAEMKAAQEELAEAERFGELQFNEKKLLEQKISQLQGEVEALKPKAAPPPEAKAPEMKDFTNEQGQVDWDKYTDAKADYAAKQAVKAERERQAEEKRAEVTEKLRAKHQTSEDKAKEAHKDWDQVMSKIQGTAADNQPQFVLNFMSESDISGELRYYLASHPEEAEKIAKLSPIRGIKELGRIEDSLIKPSTAAKETPAVEGATAKPGAPPPITPLSGSGTGAVNTDPSKMTYKELRAYERERARKRH